MWQIRYIHVIILIQQIIINCSTNHLCFNQLNLGFEQDKRRNGTVVYSSEMMGLSFCIKTCFTRTYCRFINYNKLTLTCEFVVPVCHGEPGRVTESSWISAKMDDKLQLWTKDTYSIQRQCKWEDVMFPLQSRQETCLLQGKCPPAPAIAHADKLSISRLVGNTVSYMCRTDYMVVGNPCITCLENLKWSPINFRCEEGLKCYDYTPEEKSEVGHGTSEKEVCERNGRRHKYNPAGCDVCECCAPKT